MLLLQFLGALMLAAVGYVGYLIANDIYSTHAEARNEVKRQAEVVDLRRRYVDLAPDDPNAHERFGDALRSAGHPRDALTAYLAAERLIEAAPPTEERLPNAPGMGLETKIRLARLEIAEQTDPGRYGQTMHTRQQVCRQCGYLAGYHERDCPTCGAPLPVDTPLDVIRHEGIRAALARETVQFSIKAAIAVLAIGVAFAIPNPILKFTVLICAVIVLAALFLRRLGNPTLGG